MADGVPAARLLARPQPRRGRAGARRTRPGRPRSRRPPPTAASAQRRRRARCAFDPAHAEGREPTRTGPGRGPPDRGPSVSGTSWSAPRMPHRRGPAVSPSRPQPTTTAAGTIHSVPAAVSLRASSVGSGIGGRFPLTSPIFRLRGAAVEQLDDAVGDIRLGDPGEDPPDRIAVGCGIEIRDRVDGDTDVVAEVECGPGARLDAGAGGNSAEYQLRDAALPEFRVEVGSVEGAPSKVGMTRSCSWSANSSMISAKSGPGGSGRSRSCSTRPGAGPPIATRITGSRCR